jgi:hypothetical protein
LSGINKEELFKEFLDFLNQKYKTKPQQIEFSSSKEIKIPLSIFNETLGPLESIVKYLKDNLKLSYDEISKLLFRSKSSLSITYKDSSRKYKEKLDAKSSYSVPVSIFSNLKLSVLESIVKHLKETQNLSYHNIAVLLKRDDRTIWTVYNRSLNKNG